MKSIKKSYRKILLVTLFALIGLSTGAQKSYAVFRCIITKTQPLYVSKCRFLAGPFHSGHHYRGGTCLYIPYSAFSTQAVLGPQRINFAITTQPCPCFVGRTKEMESLAPSFRKKGKLVVLPPITGFGGLGKTQLVHQLIEKYEHNYDYIVWISAATAKNIESSYLQIAAYWDIVPMLDQDPNIAVKNVLQTVQNRLNDKHVLYVFDDAPDLITIYPYLQKGHVLITSRNNSKVDWISEHFDAPLALAPFSDAEALKLASAMGQNSKDAALVNLIKLLPKYPLVTKQLLSVMLAGQYTPAAFLYAMAQNSELIAQLKASPQKLTYKASIFDILKTVLEGLQSKENGQALLQLVQELACLDMQPIPRNFVLLGLGKEEEKKQTGDILLALERCGLIRQEKQNIYMDDLIQTVIGADYPLTSTQVENLIDRYVDYIGDVVAWKLYPPTKLGSQMLPHAKKLLKYVQDKRGEGIYAAKCFLELSRLYCQQGNNEKACTMGEKALSIFLEAYGNNTSHIDIAAAYSMLGMVYAYQERYDKAIDYYQKSYKIWVAIYGDVPKPEIASCYHNLGAVYHEQRQYDQAIKYYQQSLEVCAAIFGDKPSLKLALLYENIAASYYAQWKFWEAVIWWKKEAKMNAACQKMVPCT